MKHISKLAFLLLLSLSIPQVACNGDDSSECGEIFCTLELRLITVFIQDADGNPVALDAYEVINLENGENLPTFSSDADFEAAQQTGVYPIAGDGTFPINQEAELQIRGFINDVEVITSNYMVATDCCHINLVSGATELILE